MKKEVYHIKKQAYPSHKWIFGTCFLYIKEFKSTYSMGFIKSFV
ncbi:MAG: hypothetical protein WC867_02490 [Candidatus Pacearchaeota archaeon]